MNQFTSRYNKKVMVSCLLKRKTYILPLKDLKCRVHSSKWLKYTVQKKKLIFLKL